MFPSRWFGAAIGALVLLVLACALTGALRLDGASADERAAASNLLIAAGLGAGVLGGIVGALAVRRRGPAPSAAAAVRAPAAPAQPRVGTLDNSAFQASIAALQAAAEAARRSTARRQHGAPEPAASDGWNA